MKSQWKAVGNLSNISNPTLMFLCMVGIYAIIFACFIITLPLIIIFLILDWIILTPK